MTQNKILTAIPLLAAAFILAPFQIKAKCNSCNEFGISCVNENSFNICSGGRVVISKIFSCPPGKICADTMAKCEDAKPGVEPACKPIIGCNICNEDKMFACTSRTTFVQCNGKLLTNHTGVCPGDLVCYSQGGEICRDECNRPAEIECDRDAPL